MLEKQQIQDNQDFGKLKNIFNQLLSESIANNDIQGKKLFKKYINELKKNKILQTQFLVYSNIENKVDSDINRITLFIDENINLISKFKKNDIINANNRLVKILKENNISMDTSSNDLTYDITNLIHTKRNAININSIVESKSNIINYIVNNKKELINEHSNTLPLSMQKTIMVNKFNEYYSTNLNESEQKILKTLINSTDDEKYDIYKTTINECIKLIDDKFEGLDIETKDRLLRVKHKLLSENYLDTNDFVKKISKVFELKKSLEG